MKEENKIWWVLKSIHGQLFKSKVGNQNVNQKHLIHLCKAHMGMVNLNDVSTAVTIILLLTTWRLYVIYSQLEENKMGYVMYRRWLSQISMYLHIYYLSNSNIE